MADKPFVGFGVRRGRIYELDQYGHPKAPDTSPYIGLNLYGIRAFNLTDPPARIISHFDGDKVAQQQTFPPTDASSGSINIDGSDMDVNALVGSVIKRDISGIEILPSMTDQRGNEPLIGLLVYQAAKDSSGNIGWHTRIVPRTTAIKQDGSLGENNYETIYNLAPSASDSHLWGEVLTTGADGTAHAGWIEAFSPNPAMVTAWKANGVETEFDFDEDHQSPDANYSVFRANGSGVMVAITSGLTKLTTGLDFDYAVPTGHILMAIHQFPAANA
jgi:hypothetical protein